MSGSGSGGGSVRVGRRWMRCSIVLGWPVAGAEVSVKNRNDSANAASEAVL